jgi:hypothetical protein
MNFLRKLWRLLDRRVERALAPEFNVHELTHPRHHKTPTPHPADHMVVPPPRRGL